MPWSGQILADIIQSGAVVVVRLIELFRRPEPHHHHRPPDQPGFYHAAWATVLDLKNAGAALYVVVIEVPRHCED